MIQESKIDMLVDGLLQMEQSKMPSPPAGQELLSLAADFLPVAAGLLPAAGQLTLLYYNDLARKGYKEILKARQATAAGYFTKLEMLVNSDLLQKDHPYYICAFGLFLAHYYTTTNIQPGKADNFLDRSIKASQFLYANTEQKSFFYRLIKFGEIYQCKALIKNQQPGAVFRLLDLFSQLFRDKVADEMDCLRDSLIGKAFNELYTLSVLSPSFNPLFRQELSCLSRVAGKLADSSYPSLFFRVWQLLDENNMDEAITGFMEMLRRHSVREEVYMLLSVYGRLHDQLTQEGNFFHTAFRMAGKRFFAGQIPAYIINIVFKETFIPETA